MYRTRARLFFEGTIERQEAVAGPVGEPRGATSISTTDEHRVVSIRVLRTYRGEAQGTVSVSTGSGEGDVDSTARREANTLYADKDDNENLVTSICSGTSLLGHPDTSLRRLMALRFGPAWVELPLVRDKTFVVATRQHTQTSRKKMAVFASGTFVLGNICAPPNERIPLAIQRSLLPLEIRRIDRRGRTRCTGLPSDAGKYMRILRSVGGNLAA